MLYLAGSPGENRGENCKIYDPKEKTSTFHAAVRLFTEGSPSLFIGFRQKGGEINMQSDEKVKKIRDRQKECYIHRAKTAAPATARERKR